jgi:hypothetical protein
MTKDTYISTDKVKKMINSCDFVEEDFRKEWEEKTDDLPQDTLQIIYKKFKDSKKQIDDVYIRIALSHDPTRGELIKEAIKVFNKII